MRSSVPCAALALLAGCASGPVFVAPEASTDGSAALYLYRASSLLGAGTKQEIRVAARPLGTMLNGSWLRVELDASPRTTYAEAPDCWPPIIWVPLRHGLTTYVQVQLVNRTVEYGGRQYFDYGCRLVQRAADEALPVLRGLRRAN
ncbi:MAG: hypothetical protein HS128_00585 [Ideonella sp.]|nr:hypothetical protein [Ideonella sp.]MCC7457541.1 hypothetical protein [Nitrospira sp.]